MPPNQISRDHILIQALGGFDVIHGDVRNVVVICRSCNMLRAECFHCWGAVACVRSVAESTKRTMKDIMQAWNFRYVTIDRLVPDRPKKVSRRPPDGYEEYSADPNAHAIQIGMAVNRAGPEEFVWPADTPAKKVWNVATLARFGYVGPVPEDLR